METKFGLDGRINMEEKDRCQCDFYTTYDLLRWATIMECRCVCHDTEDIMGHEGLCCEFPNGKRKDNPHSELKSAIEYRNMIEDIKRDEEWDATT